MNEFDSKKHLNVALSHFSPVLLSENAKRGPKQHFISAIDSKTGLEIGMTAIDRIAGSNAFYALPNCTYSSALSYLTIIENEKIAKGSAVICTTRLSSSSKAAVRMAAEAIVKEDELTTTNALKVQKRQDADNAVRATFTEVQEKLLKGILKEMKVKIAKLEAQLSEANTSLRTVNDALTAERVASDTIIDKHIEKNKNLSNGIQRCSVLTDSWHALHPSFSNHLFGFKTFDEYKIYCIILFPDLQLLSSQVNSDPITEWEKCTMAIMRFRRKLSIQILGAIWNRSRTLVGGYVVEWSLKWGRAGENLTELDLTADYLSAERPQIFIDANQEDVAVLVDGKDFMVNDPKKNSAIKRATWSDKVNHSAGRLITWSTPAGLIVEVSPLFLGRATESAIVSLWGSYHGTVPLTKVPEIELPNMVCTKTESYKDRSIILTAAIREERMRARARGADEDIVLHADNEDANDEILEAEADANESVLAISLTSRSIDFLQRMRDREVRTQSGKKYSAKQIKEMNHHLLRQGPNESSTRKLEQLTVHEKLDEAYRNKSLSNCILAYYVKHQKPLRDEMFRHLRGEAGEDIPPMLLTRLAKIPIGGAVLADRGFYFDAPSYPNVNAQITPHFLTGRDQFEENEISKDLIACRLRWSSEAVFSRVTDQEALTDVIPYDYFSILDSMIKWGHAHANLMQPFNQPRDYRN